MSLFINSKVHLPSSCEKCPFNYADISTGICTAADKTIDTRTYGRKRHPDCPLSEIPTPHGDLIDKEPIKKFILDGINKPSPESYGYDGIEILSEIEFAPAIIEAEVSE